ncbi:hypothetical protein BCM20_000096 [Clostridium beijerinckii]|nr:hypothetical protein [Clostridium beijerinckii]NYC00141.1 hypothetical protein [Clostridium beijerinckii]
MRFFSGTVNDSNYLELMEAQTKNGDIRVADLGYY